MWTTILDFKAFSFVTFKIGVLPFILLLVFLFYICLSIVIYFDRISPSTPPVYLVWFPFNRIFRYLSQKKVSLRFSFWDFCTFLTLCVHHHENQFYLIFNKITLLIYHICVRACVCISTHTSKKYSAWTFYEFMTQNL